MRLRVQGHEHLPQEEHSWADSEHGDPLAGALGRPLEAAAEGCDESFKLREMGHPYFFVRLANDSMTLHLRSGQLLRAYVGLFTMRSQEMS